MALCELGSVPVAVPGIFVGVGAHSSSADRCHSFTSLHQPQAALGSLPRSASFRFKHFGVMYRMY